MTCQNGNFPHWPFQYKIHLHVLFSPSGSWQLSFFVLFCFLCGIFFVFCFFVLLSVGSPTLRWYPRPGISSREDRDLCVNTLSFSYACDVLCTTRYSCAQGPGVLLNNSKPKSVKSLACWFLSRSVWRSFCWLKRLLWSPALFLSLFCWLGGFRLYCCTVLVLCSATEVKSVRRSTTTVFGPTLETFHEDSWFSISRTSKVPSTAAGSPATGILM